MERREGSGDIRKHGVTFEEAMTVFVDELESPSRRASIPTGWFWSASRGSAERSSLWPILWIANLCAPGGDRRSLLPKRA